MTTDNRDPDDTSANSAVSPIRVELDEYQQPSVATAEAVAAVVGRPPTELPPLYDYVDPEALDAIITRDGVESGESVRVSFEYEGVDVLVDSRDGVEIRPND